MQLEELIPLLNAEKAQAVTIFQNGKCLLTHARRCYPFDTIADLERALTKSSLCRLQPVPIPHPSPPTHRNQL